MVWAAVAVAGAAVVTTGVSMATQDKEKPNKNQRGAKKKERNGGAAMEATNQLLDPAQNLGGFLE